MALEEGRCSVIYIRDERHLEGIATALELARTTEGQSRVTVGQNEICNVDVQAVDEDGNVLATFEVWPDGELLRDPVYSL